MQTTIRVGVYDWTHFAIDGGFYAHDLPDEWRLGYFANEFETACIRLTPQILQQTDDLEWLEDLPPGFRLYFDTPPEFLCKSDLLPQLNAFKTVISGCGIAPASHIMDAAQHCWTPQSARESAFALMPGDETTRQYRQWIEQWMELAARQGSQQESILWLQGDTASYARLTELRTLVELMGF